MFDKILNWLAIIILFAFFTMIIWGITVLDQSTRKLNCLINNQCQENK